MPEQGLRWPPESSLCRAGPGSPRLRLSSQGVSEQQVFPSGGLPWGRSWLKSTTRCSKSKPPVWVGPLCAGSIVTGLEVRDAVSTFWLCSCPVTPFTGLPGKVQPGSCQAGELPELRSVAWPCSVALGLPPS